MAARTSDRRGNVPSDVREAYHGVDNKMMRLRALHREARRCIDEMYRVLSDLNNEEAMREPRDPLH